MSGVDRGKYIVKISGCNDCHTPGYVQAGSDVPEEVWLIGDELGWYGPWGTTYPTNLRLYMRNFTEEEWVEKAKTLRARPPMPWFALNQMAEEDLRAVYQFVRSLEPYGDPAPPYLPPGREPRQPYVQFPMFSEAPNP
jgi:mono/diheme cytochrome c family protein